MNDKLITDAMQTTLYNIQKCKLEILDNFIDICEKYDLTYYADSGTLLGAIRHNGFIPWDDDIDIAMPRTDFNKLIEISDDAFSYPYALACAQKDNLFEPIAKVMKIDTTWLNRWEVPNTADRNSDGTFKYMHCIDIDICPIDHIKDEEDEKIDNMLNTVYDVLQFRNYFSYRIATHFEYNDMYDYNDRLVIAKLVEKLFTRLNKSYLTSNKVVLSGWLTSNTCKFYLPSDVYANKEYRMFKGLKHQLCIPSGWDTILTAEYGNYMTPVKYTQIHDFFNKVIVSTNHSCQEFSKYSSDELIEILDKVVLARKMIE